MKTLVVLLATLIFGLAIGGTFGYRTGVRETLMAQRDAILRSLTSYPNPLLPK